jgi:propanediol dehydratase-reactivating factor small subunit
VSECARTPSWMEGSQPEKPAILVLSVLDGPLQNEVLAGIEEEGVPYEVERVGERPSDGQDAYSLACEAASRSSLDVGVGIDAHGRVCIQHEKLREPVPALASVGAADRSFARVAGHNAARIVVGIPLRTALP